MHSASLESIHNIYQLRIHAHIVSFSLSLSHFSCVCVSFFNIKCNSNNCSAQQQHVDGVAAGCVLAYVNIWTLSVIMQRESRRERERERGFFFFQRLLWSFFGLFSSYSDTCISKMKFILMRLRYCYYLSIYVRVR